MTPIIALNLAALVTTATAYGGLRNNAFLGSGMRPDVVAQTLVHVMDDWKAQAHVCALPATQEGCKQASSAFDNSCGKIAHAIVQGSVGNVVDATEYMNDVCGQRSIFGWYQTGCASLKQAITGTMTTDVLHNREHFPVMDTCGHLWKSFLNEQKELHKKDIEEQEAQEKKEAELAAEEAKKAAAEAEAKAKAEAEAEKQRKAEEDAEAEAAKKRLADAKAKVAESMDQERAKFKKVESKAEEEIKEAAEVEKDQSMKLLHKVEKKAEKKAEKVEKKAEKGSEVEKKAKKA